MTHAHTEQPDNDSLDTPDFAELGLPEAIVKTLANNGVTTPFPIQAATIPDALSGRDVLGRGRTGSGKTLSFGLPLLVALAADDVETQAKHPRGLILTPTRELAMQVAEDLDPYARAVDLDMKVVCGGTSMPRQIEALRRGVDVLVATPGRLRDLVRRNVCSLDSVAVAVLDEADRMADMGFLPEVIEILDQVPADGQRMLFSATLEDEIGTLVNRYLKEPVTHEVDSASSSVTTMSHHVLVVKPRTKSAVTAAIAGREGRTIAFVRTQLGCDRVAAQLREAGVRADALHGGLTQQARSAVLDRFKGGSLDALVATDVAARGIHVDGIDLVLHVDPARDGKDYVHRAGRTARAGRSGTVVTLALPHQRKTVFRLLEDVDAEVSRHIVDGAFDAELERITGARSLTDMEAVRLGREAELAQREAEELTARAESLAQRAARLNGEAAQMRDRAAKERSGEIPMPAPDADFGGSQDGGRKPYRGQGGGRRGERRDRWGGGERGGREQRGGGGGRGRFDDRGHSSRRDKRGGGHPSTRDKRDGGRSPWRDRRS
ncbi:MAG TPA: DEAD/DEAH box helicase [Stackebrandtia sp.]|uniref:DEAD/DEAH box helicase n=1 Tax=Stackebrandtia sp. TaxID=2023065 RepID=UPI002D6B75D7|nr:DEAD/DEAH box helicase [Stackebrandtia sp.]HZE40254.1 DEAD/DEAH box helicase [Stackebrandtia sp.]